MTDKKQVESEKAPSAPSYEELLARVNELSGVVETLANREVQRATESGQDIRSPEDVVKVVKGFIEERGRPIFRPLRGQAREDLDAMDPLAWIDEETMEVMLVGRVGSLPLRQGWTTPAGVNIPKMRLAHQGSPRPWFSCPYEFSGPTPRDTESMMLFNRDWHHFRLNRYTAEDAWIGKMPLPESAVIQEGDIERVDNGVVFGKKYRASGIPLREIVRYMLQIHPQGLWFDTDMYCPFYAGDMAGKGEPVPHIARLPDNEPNPRFIDKKTGEPRRFTQAFEPNPYHKGCVAASGSGIPTPFARTGYRVNSDFGGHDSARAVEQITAEMLRVQQR